MPILGPIVASQTNLETEPIEPQIEETLNKQQNP